VVLPVSTGTGRSLAGTSRRKLADSGPIATPFRMALAEPRPVPQKASQQTRCGVEWSATPPKRSRTATEETRLHPSLPGSLARDGAGARAHKKAANRNANVWHGATENGPWMMDGPIPNPNVVRVAPGTGNHRVEGNRRASRNGLVAISHPQSLPSRFATFASLGRTWNCL
jgi:hypothetical protein